MARKSYLHGLKLWLVMQNVALAVRALHELNATQAQIGTKARLVLAGGYDARLAENRQYFGELQQQIEQLGLQGQVPALPHGRIT